MVLVVLVVLVVVVVVAVVVVVVVVYLLVWYCPMVQFKRPQPFPQDPAHTNRHKTQSSF